MNFGTLVAAILIGAPVLGLRPVRAGRAWSLNVPEADQRQLLIGLDGFNNGIENGLQNASGFGLRKFFGSCDLFNELLTIHKRFSFNRQLWANARPADF